ncbi:MAG TPA: hypothetical protein QF564_13310 [Pirellulaceae bacterium]|jgi:hypothetical protein|nr:hypothetical protein [Pirellulaceae bacterium]
MRTQPVVMQHTHQLEAIRDIVSSTFSEYSGAELECCETVLIRDGTYCGRCYTCDAIRAIWFAEENVVKFYGKEGQFLASRPVNGGIDHEWRQQAA